MGALWVDASESAGAIAATLGVLAGAVIAVTYGRKATVQVSGEAHLVGDHRVLLSARPSVCGVGIFRLHFDEGDGATVRVTEVLASSSEAPSEVGDGFHWEELA